MFAATFIEAGETLNIDQTTAQDNYLARNGGVLNANGANTFEVLINSGSVLNAVGGTYAGRSGNAGVSVTNASASLTDAIVTGDRMGMSVNRVAGSPTGSSAVISGSQITGRTAGLETSGGSTTVMTDTHLTATAATGVGLNSFGGEVHAKGGSITGGLHGIRLRPDTQGIGNGANVILDNVQVQGQTGAAILATSGVTSHIQVLNYTRLLSGNGILLDVQEASNVTMEVVGSTLEGKLNVADNSTANLAFQHGLMAGDVLVGEASTTALHLDRSELRGNIDIADNSKGDLIFDQSQMTGDVLVNDSTATVVFTNGSNLEGNVSFTGNSSAGLTFDQSQMKGDVLIDSLPDTTTLNFANNSSLTGNVDVAGGSHVDLNFDQSQLAGDVRVAGNSTTQMALNNSTFLGNLNISDGSTGHLNFDRGSLAGTVLVDGSTATLTMGSGSVLEGNVNIAGNSIAELAFDQSRMTGDVIATGGSTTNLYVSADSLLTGAVDIADGSTGNLKFNQGHMAGDVRVNDSTATVAFANGSSLEGNVNFTGDSVAELTFDQSQMKGDVLIDGLPDTTAVNFANNSVLTGNVNIAGGSNVDLRFDQSQLTGDVRVAGNSTTQMALNNSTFLGNLNISDGSTGHLNFDRGSLAGNVLVDGSTATLTMGSGSVLEGNVNIAGNSIAELAFDQSRMTGDVIATGGSTTNLYVSTDSLLTGAVDIAEGSTGNLKFNQGHMVGDVRVNDSTATVAFANGSSLEGNVNFTGNSRAELTFDQSQMKGDVLIDSLPDTTAVNFANNSVLTGNVNIAGGSNVDLRFDQSQLAGDVRVAGNSTTQMALNNSTFLGNLNISDDSTANLTLNQSQMTGDVRVDGLNTTESVTLENQSQLTGRLDKVNSVNIKSESNWTLTGNDNIGTLAMNGGSVTFGAAEATSTYYTLNVGTLAGTTGTFVMKGDFVSGDSDKLIVAGQSTGTYGLAVAASGRDAVAPEQVVLVRTGTTDGASFTLAGDRAVDLGTWSYSLASRTNAEGGKEWYLDPTTEVISPGARSILALFNTPVTSWYGEQWSLRTRMGELRLNGGQSGGWMRTYGSQYNVADGSGVGYQQNQQGISLGADARVGDSQWLVGVLAGTSKSDLNLDHGTTGTVKSYYVGPYATWLDADTGYYFDGVLKFNRFRNESKVNLSDATRAKGDYDNWGLGASAEFGRQFKLADGYFIEPFTQWSAVQIQGKRYTLDNDMTADGDTTRSLLGKAGVTVGRNFEFGKASIAQPYLRMAVAHEFAKNNEVKVNDNVFNNDLSGTRGEFGAGVAVAMSEKWQVHADFDYSNGEHIEKPWGATLGFRFYW
ncbi:autotransporter outer membrane beta-barrel domain-containing protein [Pseudomonas sp. NPDC088429]|uniref:autotransporter outer membrane beta-barrel domain-containing protein n=1 Tax=Pseudomonas sp. NPDC088429 TaxID=3364455 RepID=UPI00381F4756